MPELNRNEYSRVMPILGDWDAELSVMSVLTGEQTGTVIADDAQHPHAALVKTSETCLICGDPDAEIFYAEAKSFIGKYQAVMLGDPSWEQVLPKVHPNPYMKKYTRFQLTAQRLVYTGYRGTIPQGFELRSVDREILTGSYANLGPVLHWAEQFDDIDGFLSRGAGFAVVHGNTLCAWGMTDCRCGDEASIGLVTAPEYRRMGFGAAVTAALAEHWFSHGMKSLQWLCTCRNAGSQATAKKLGFVKRREYLTYAALPPWENDTDCPPEIWEEWFHVYDGAPLDLYPEYGEARARCARLAGRLHHE